MTVVAWILAAVLALAAGRLILWTSLRRGSGHASTLQAATDSSGIIEYSVAALGLACRGHVLVHHTRADALGPRLLRGLRGLQPAEVVAVLRAEGLRAELMPGAPETLVAGPSPTLTVPRAGRRTAD
jgi:hypothetical protein